MILVTGTGRSGTSTVARLLHEELGVQMGERFDPPNSACPEGSYEDLDFRELHMRFERGAIGLPQFRGAVKNLAAWRDSEPGPWGLKDPRTAGFIGLYLAWFSPLVIWCTRDLEATARSWTRVTTSGLAEARGQVRDRHWQLEAVLAGWPNVVRIDFTEPRSDETVLGELLAVLDPPILDPRS